MKSQVLPWRLLATSLSSGFYPEYCLSDHSSHLRGTWALVPEAQGQSRWARSAWQVPEVHGPTTKKQWKGQVWTAETDSPGDGQGAGPAGARDGLLQGRWVLGKASPTQEPLLAGAGEKEKRAQRRREGAEGPGVWCSHGSSSVSRATL